MKTKYLFVYTDGTEEVYEFATYEEVSWYANNEGDHLMYFEPIQEK